jgi:PKD repeat protein
VITAPAGATTITVGESVSFAGSATDENPGTVDYLWDFDGAAADSTSATPGAITFNSVGTYTVSLTVTDDEGLADPTPATVIITVNPFSGTLIHADGFE